MDRRCHHRQGHAVTAAELTMGDVMRRLRADAYRDALALRIRAAAYPAPATVPVEDRRYLPTAAGTCPAPTGIPGEHCGAPLELLRFDDPLANTLTEHRVATRCLGPVTHHGTAALTLTLDPVPRPREEPARVVVRHRRSVSV
jgi:hypothetical protein